MTDVFLYPGEASANDVRLRDPTTAAAGSAQNIVDAGGIASAEAIGQPDVIAVLDGGSVASAEAFGGTVISASIIDAGAIASAEALGSITLAAVIAGGSIISAEAFGAPVISATIGAAGGVASAEAFGGSDVLAVIGGAGGIASAESFGLPIVFDPAAPWNIVDAGGIASEEALGAPLVSVPAAVVPVIEPQFGGAPPRLRPRPGQSEFIYIAPHLVRGVGAIESQEAFGSPVISTVPPIRAHKVRDEEWLLRPRDRIAA